MIESNHRVHFYQLTIRGEEMMQRERDENLMVVAAVEGYSLKMGLPPAETFDLFRRNDVFAKIRKSYGALHTQGLDESVEFAADILASGPTV
jgi:hypothetical protein